MTENTLLHADDALCRSFLSSVELIGRRWSSGIVLAIARGATRFSEIVERVSGISDRLASQRLKELEASGLVRREVIASTPVQVRYALTEQGRELFDALQPLAEYGQRWRPEPRR